MSATKLKVSPGDEVVLSVNGHPAAVAVVTHVTPAGYIDATTGKKGEVERWNPRGNPHGDHGMFQTRHIAIPSPSTRARALEASQRATAAELLRMIGEAVDPCRAHTMPAVALPDVIRNLQAALDAATKNEGVS